MRYFFSWVSFLLLLAALGRPALAQNVGIGTTSPTQTLDVNGTLRLRGSSGTDVRLLQTDANGNVTPAASAYPAAAALTPALAATATGLNNPLVAVSGTLAVVLNRGASSLSLYDLSSPTAPVLRGTYSGAGISSGVAVALSGSTAVVQNNNATYTMEVFALGSGAPTSVATITPPAANSAFYGGVALVGSTLYAVYDRGGGFGYFYAYDLGTPASPQLLGTGNSGYFTPSAVAAAGSLVAVSNMYGGVNIINVSNPAAPTVAGSTVSTYTYNGNARPVALGPGTLCTLTSGSNQLETYSLSAAGVPTLRHTFSTDANPVSVALNGSLAYVACRGSNTLQVIDVGGAAAVLRGSGTLSATPNNVAATPALALAANGSAANNLQVFSTAFLRTVTVSPDGSIGSAPAPVPADFVQNQTATAQLAGFNISGTGTAGRLGLGTGTAAPATQLVVRGTGSALPVSGGTTQSAGHYARFGDNTTQVLDLGGNGLGGQWLQSVNSANLGSYNPLLLNPNGGNVGIGTTSAPATRLDVNGNLRLAVRTCPVNTSAAYTLTAADLAFSIFKVQVGSYASPLTLPGSGSGQVAGQELTVYSLASAPVVINGANTDNAADVTLAAAGTAGMHAVKYIWDGMWVRVQ